MGGSSELGMNGVIQRESKPSAIFWKHESRKEESLTADNVVSDGKRSRINHLHRLSLDSILRAVRVYDVCKETPLDYGQCISAATGNKIWLKREDLQNVFSFKIRGAYNKMVSMTEEQRSKGVTACSAGNHAQGVAYSARHLGLSSKIFMPVITPLVKVDAVRRLGAEVVLFGNTFDECQAACRRCVAEEGRELVHPFDDLDVIAGQGVTGLEILKQHPAPIDAVFVAVGGGGLISGIGSCLKSISPQTKIIGVEGFEAPGMTESLKRGHVVTLDSIGTFADGAAVKTPGENTFRICYHGGVVDETVLVDTDEICGAIKDAFADVRVVLEPAGALAVAGMKKYIQHYGCKGQSFVAILSGANTDFNRLRFISTRADTSEHLIGLVIPEKPGVFRKVYDAICPRSVTEFSYRIQENPVLYAGQENCDSCEPKAKVLLSYRSLPGVKDKDDFEAVKAIYEAEGLEVIDLQNCELAKSHGRHLVGGRSEGAQDEVLCRFEYPERPGSLQTFLHCLPEQWNVSLFHYRNHGADVGRILAGIQVPQETRVEFCEFLDRLKVQGYLCFVETDNAFYKMFLKHPKQL